MSSIHWSFGNTIPTKTQFALIDAQAYFFEKTYRDIDEVFFVENESSWNNCSRHGCDLLRALILVVDIEQNGKQQHDAFDYLLPVDSYSHNGHAIVQHADKKSPDQCADDFTDTAHG